MFQGIYSRAEALTLLRIGTGNPKAQFREGQEEAIKAILCEGKRLLLVQKTGWGKSYVYFIIVKLLRQAKSGPALLVSPLIALMRDQVRAAEAMGLNCEIVDGTHKDLYEDSQSTIAWGSVDLIITTPEQLAKEEFRTSLINRVGSISFLIVDEAHCISDWGHDFRPDYRYIKRLLSVFPDNIPLLATTATANNRVIEDLEEILSDEELALTVQRGDLVRESLTLQTIELSSEAERMAWLVQFLEQQEGCGIVYTLTTARADVIAEWLMTRGIKAFAYHGDVKDRPELEEQLRHNKVKALVATCALGMGFDKSDIAFVVHVGAPNNVIRYYQEVGRAGRGIDKAYGIILSVWDEDYPINNFFINSAFPTISEIDELFEVLNAEPEGLTMNDLLAQINMADTRLEKILKILMTQEDPLVIKEVRSLEGGRKQTFYQRALASDKLQSLRALSQQNQLITDLRRNEYQDMRRYLQCPFGMHMDYLIKALDGTVSSRYCSRLPPVSIEIDPSLVKEYDEFLVLRCGYEIKPRKQNPNRKRLEPEAVFEKGMAICHWGDPIGRKVSQWKYQTEVGTDDHDQLTEELVNFALRCILKWDIPINDFPLWVTCVESSNRIDLVPDIAARIAQRLELPFSRCFHNTAMGEELKQQMNSHHKYDLLMKKVTVPDPRRVLRGSVLIIDDIVDSRWSFAYCASLLRNNGSGRVYPFALAMKTQGNS